MKTVYYIFIILLAFSLTSCLNDFLDVEPVSDLASETFWQTEADAETGLNAAYAQVAKNYNTNDGFLYWFEIRAADTWHTQSQSIELMDANTNKLHAGMNATSWNGFYKAIGRINYALHYIGLMDDSKISVEAKNHHLAEASFLRAKMYFDMIRIWGDVPLVTEPTLDPDITKMYVSRTPKDEVMAQILDDIDFAIKNVNPTKTDPYKFTIGAAYALKTHVSMWNKDYQTAFNATSELIKLNRYSLQEIDNWSNIFIEGNTSENIWSIKWNYANMGNNRYIDLLGKNSSSACVNKQFITDWEENSPEDKRLWLTFDTTAVSTWETHLLENNIFRFGPWKSYGVGKPDYAEGRSEKPFAIYRLADIFLLRAEAANQLGNTAEALKYLNLIRVRADLTAFTENDITNASDPKKMLAELIFSDRQKELISEGHQWFDLVRTGRVKEVMNDVFENYYKVWGRTTYNLFSDDECELLFPVNDQVMLESNGNIVQNPCY